MDSFQITKTQYKVSDFVSWQKSGSLNLSPSFQRRPVWKTGAKSYFVDTIVRSLPVPIIFLREQKSDLRNLEPTREVVDGQQRIRTLLSYIDTSLLQDFKESRDSFVVESVHNSDLANKGFWQLDDELRQRILDYEFSVHVLPRGVDDRDILQIFARMNATGVKLNAQELRNAEYFGEFKTSVYNLAFEQLFRWRKWRILTEDNIARMTEVEFTSELVLITLNGVARKTQKNITQKYKQYEYRYPERAEIERRFRIVMETIDEKFGHVVADLFRERARFYGLFAFVYDVQFGISSPITQKPPKSVPTRMVEGVIAAGRSLEEGTAPESVAESVARRTTDQSSRQNVVDYLRSKAQNGRASD